MRDVTRWWSFVRTHLYVEIHWMNTFTSSLSSCLQVAGSPQVVPYKNQTKVRDNVTFFARIVPVWVQDTPALCLTLLSRACSWAPLFYRSSVPLLHKLWSYGWSAFCSHWEQLLLSVLCVALYLWESVILCTRYRDFEAVHMTNLMCLQPNLTIFTRSQGLEAYMKNKDFCSPFILDEDKAEMLRSCWRGGRTSPPQIRYVFVRAIIRTDPPTKMSYEVPYENLLCSAMLMPNPCSSYIYTSVPTHQICLVTLKSEPFTSVCSVDSDMNDD